MSRHSVYMDGDEGIPEQLLGRNGEVALDMCRHCGKAESELSGPCLKAPPLSREQRRAPNYMEQAYAATSALVAAQIQGIRPAIVPPFVAEIRRRRDRAREVEQVAAREAALLSGSPSTGRYGSDRSDATQQAEFEAFRESVKSNGTRQQPTTFEQLHKKIHLLTTAMRKIAAEGDESIYDLRTIARAVLEEAGE